MELDFDMLLLHGLRAHRLRLTVAQAYDEVTGDRPPPADDTPPWWAL